MICWNDLKMKCNTADGLFAKSSTKAFDLFSVSIRNTFIVVCVIVGFVCCGDSTLPAVPGLPEKIGKLDLRGVEKGVTANKLMYRMHGKITGARSNSVIGYYGADSTKKVLYLSAFEDDTRAEKALKEMSSKIMHTKAGFTPATVDTTGGRVLYRTEGMGLTHFFYRQDNFVVWWQVRPENAEVTLVSLRNFYFKTN